MITKSWHIERLIKTKTEISSLFLPCVTKFRNCWDKHRRLQTWWRHQMETFSMLLALCEGNPPVTGAFPSQRPVAWSFHVFFDLRLNKRLSKQTIRRSFETPSCPLWCHYDGFPKMILNPWIKIQFDRNVAWGTKRHITLHVMQLHVMWFQWDMSPWNA